MNTIKWDGTPINIPGIYSGIEINRYHEQLTSTPSISSSGLRTIFHESPAHYWDTSYLNPERDVKSDSSAFALGRAAHHLLLGEANFNKMFLIRPDEIDGKPWHGNRTECRAWNAWADSDGRTVLTKKRDIDAIRGMSRSMSKHPLVSAGILNGVIEHSMIWRDEETGVWLKARPDAIPTDSGDVADLKTTTDITDDGIANSIGKYGYHMQAALVGMAYRALLSREMESFSLVFVESSRPHCCRVKTLKADDIELGEKMIRNALKQFVHGLTTNEWLGPGGVQSDAEYVSIKPWARTEAENQLAYWEALK
jgi:hypothetical protein